MVKLKEHGSASGQPWSFMGKRPWLTMVLVVPFNKTWSTMFDHGCMTMNNHGRPW